MRVRMARRAYIGDLEDRVTILKLAATLLADNEGIQRAIRDGDQSAGAAEAAAFTKLYPDSDLVLLKKDGTIVATVGCDSAGVASLHLIADALGGKPSEGLSGRGCSEAHAPTYLAARPTDAGAVVLGFRFTASDSRGRHESRTRAALVNAKGELVHATPDFPKGAESISLDERKMIDVGKKSYFVDAFTDPRSCSGRGSAYRLVAARDVTRLKARLYNTLELAFSIVALAGLLAIWWGLRTARLMSSALSRVSGALVRLKQQEYVKVDAVRTGDELEDLATGFNDMVDGSRSATSSRRRSAST